MLGILPLLAAISLVPAIYGLRDLAQRELTHKIHSFGEPAIYGDVNDLVYMTIKTVNDVPAGK